jgi:small subunit ribosomal protein S20
MLQCLNLGSRIFLNLERVSSPLVVCSEEAHNERFFTMANHKSSEKRARQTEVRRARNRHNVSTMRTQVKEMMEAIEKKNLSALDALFVKTQSALAVAARKGAIHKNNMARKISRIAAMVKKAKAVSKPA